jgi:hypothetical protein
MARSISLSTGVARSRINASSSYRNASLFSGILA